MNGSTLDGLLTSAGTANLTNGYHPLWLLVASPALLVGLDDLAAARAL